MASTDLLLRIRADVADAQRSVDAVRKSLRELGAASKLKLELLLDNVRAQFGKGIADLRAKFQEGFRDVGSGVLGEIAKNVGTLINPVGAATAAIAGLGAAIKSGFEEYRRFNDALTNLSVITGVTGDALNALGDSAREMALTFGGDASNQLDLMSQVLSKFGPSLAQNEEALKGFVERVNVFAKATGQDAATAGDQLMNVMLQLGVNVNDSAELLSESSRIMDVLAKAAQEGAAETSQLAESYLQVGSTARQLGFSASSRSVQRSRRWRSAVRLARKLALVFATFLHRSYDLRARVRACSRSLDCRSRRSPRRCAPAELLASSSSLALDCSV
ncbi:MAG: hypothetical protein KatS3mg038_1196 [Candidatus Kapaibacterium sp.]|nr:MAG: hypothetical protein KatS3mg038_1196 [Candidatus Kapabacteria bacterium]